MSQLVFSLFFPSQYRSPFCPSQYATPLCLSQYLVVSIRVGILVLSNFLVYFFFYLFWKYFHNIGGLKLVIREYFTDLYCDMPIHRNYYAEFYNHVNCKMAILR